MTNNKKTAINYTARDFSSIKQELISYAKRYYPDKYQDFNEAGFGSLVLDTVAYIGDIMSFYLDYQANESFLTTATELDNVLKISRQLGYKPETVASATGIATFYILVPSDSDGLGPDTRYIPVLSKNSTFTSNTGKTFTLAENVRFDLNDNEIAVASLDETTGLPTYFAIKSYGSVISGRYVSTSVSVGDYTRFLRLNVPLSNVIEVISVRDTDGFEYYEVENLSQDFIYRPVLNKTSTKNQADSFLRPYYVPRRFVLEKNLNSISMQFGFGASTEQTNDLSIADPSSVALKYSTKEYTPELEFDPTNLLYNDKFGIVPQNTTLSIVARISDIDNSDISANSLTQVRGASFVFEDENNLDSDILSFIRESLEVNNEEAILGAESITDTTEIKKIALSTFSSQGRAVTKEDYQSLIYRMPKKYGNIRRVNVLRDKNSLRRNLNAYVIGQDTQGNLVQINSAVKENIKIWLSQNKMINDTIDILDAKILNLQISFQIVSDLTISKDEVLSRCLAEVRNFYNRTPEIGESFFITDVYRILRNVRGVLDVSTVSVTNKVGGQYSGVIYDTIKNRSPDGRFIEIPENVIYEIKFPNVDIKGTVI